MTYEIITNFNFDETKDFVGDKPFCETREYGYHKEKNDIIFTTNFVSCPCVYWIKKGDLFCFSFDYLKVVQFCKDNNIPISDDYRNFQEINPNVRKHIKVSITKRYQYNLNYIENWEKIILHCDGSFEKIDNPFVPFQLEIKDNYDKFKTFIKTYKKCVNDCIDKGKFRPTITGGIDTRTFIGLYKNRASEVDGYFLHPVKRDGKNHYELGMAEMALAEKVVKIAGIPLNRHEELEDQITITGMYNENCSSYKNPNDPEYIYKFIQHGWDDGHSSFTNMIVPYFSNEWLEFKQDGEVNRMLLFLLLIPEYIHVPLISGTSTFNHFSEGLTLYPFMGEQLKKAQEILDYWGEDKVKEILKDE